MKTKLTLFIFLGVLAVRVSAQTSPQMMEFTDALIKNFPEKVSLQQGWMDAKFQQLDPYAAGSSDMGSLADVRLGFDVLDKNGDLINFCYVPKQLADSSQPNPLVAVVQNLKQGDKIRLFGKVTGGIGSDPYFRVENIESLDKPAAVYVPPPPLTPEQIAARKAAQKAALQKSFFTIQRMATNGEVSAQYSLGLRYLTGMGCETNREQAIYWLQKAADAGDTDASNKLVSLKK
jgi:TPR repeat protein